MPFHLLQQFRVGPGAGPGYMPRRDQYETRPGRGWGSRHRIAAVRGTNPKYPDVAGRKTGDLQIALGGGGDAAGTCFRHFADYFFITCGLLFHYLRITFFFQRIEKT